MIRALPLVLPLLIIACSGGSSSSPPQTPPTQDPALGSESSSQMLPYILPWDDASGGIANIGDQLNHKPAGQYGSLSISPEGYFSLNGQRERFWGVNITAQSAFPTQAEAQAIAGRLAKFGVNLVRFHHIDHNWGGVNQGLIDYSQGNTRHLNPQALERLDYFVAQLKAQGIYLNINLINAREFMASDGLPAEIAELDWKERHVLGFFMPAVRDLEKEYAQQLLTHLNPHTGLSYAEDPAVAFVEINNENSLFQQYYDGSMDAWPEVFKAPLRDQWNTWLNARYPDTTAAETAWDAVDEPLGTELLDNGSFATNTAQWNLEQHQGAQATATAGNYDGRHGVQVVVAQTGTESWHIQLNQSGLSLTQGQLYTLSFWLKGENLSGISTAIQRAYGDYAVLESRTLTPDAQWQPYTMTFFGSTDDDNLRVNFGGLGNQLGTLYLADISLRPGGEIGQLPEGQSLEQGNVALNTRSEGYTPGRARDWMAFLRESERDYWSDMHAYIKQDLGFNGLVAGTQLMNSPPSVQNEFPFIDAHAYWQHPVFPGEPWDPANWRVYNESMVNTLDNTLSQLANQRVDGKPFVVSEYQHASPNTFSTEGPLLIAAYAALQDWDGIYFFAYDAGANTNWDPGFFSNYFSFSAHPGKMANMALAASVFRRGQVSAAQQQVLLNFSQEKELDILATIGREWNVANASHLTPSTALAHRHRLAMDTQEFPQGADTPPLPTSGQPLMADTGELAWDLSRPNKGVVLVDTDTTKAVIGFIDNRRFELGNITIAVGETIQDWATVGLSLQSGSFAEPGAGASLLLVTTGLTDNTDMEWATPERDTVGLNWGRSPSRIEVIPLTLELPYAASRVSAWTLNPSGQRDQVLTPIADGTGSRLELDGSTATLWYEISVQPE